MAYQVSARKWRPQKFSELIGQEHIVRTLKNAIELDRLSHAYLFSGTRGVGKTTTARVLAKALNCLEPEGIEPCDHCVPCQEIREGHSVDVQEIDGASNNGVAEVRDLIENVQYATSSCKYKVYIIDEVHMLSKSAFNALLKTLEEPPPGVVFIFATTELNKIPETILSRCQCFEFKPLSHNQIIRQLEQICKQEGIEIDPVSLREIAKNGAGSMRDAQSLLDQIVAYCGKTITPGSVEEVLGTVGQEALKSFVDHLIAKDSAGLVEQVQQVADSGKDLHYFCRDLVEYIRNLMIARVAKEPAELLDENTLDLETLKKQARTFDPDELQQMFTVLARAETEMKRSSLARLVFEMAVLRLTDIRPFRKIDELIRTINEMEQSGENPAPVHSGQQSEMSPRAPESPLPESGAASSPVSGKDKGWEDETWKNLQREISHRKPYFGHYLTSCRLLSIGNDGIEIGVADGITRDRMEEPDNRQLIEQAVETVCGRKMEVRFSLFSDRSSADASPGNGADTKKKNKTGYNGVKTRSDMEILQEALDIFGGIVIR